MSKYRGRKGQHTRGLCKQQGPCHWCVREEEGWYSPVFHLVFRTVYTHVCTSFIAGSSFLMLCIYLPWLHLNKNTKIQSIAPPGTGCTLARSAKTSTKWLKNVWMFFFGMFSLCYHAQDETFLSRTQTFRMLQSTTKLLHVSKHGRKKE